MLATGLLAVALLAQQTATPPTPAPTGDGQVIVAEVLADQQEAPDMRALHTEAAGAPDSTWSPEAEAMLSHRYNAISASTGRFDSLGVTCSATLCDVAGTTRSGLSSEQINDLMMQLQTLAGENPVSGLERVLAHFGSLPGRPGIVVFASYWRRR